MIGLAPAMIDDSKELHYVSVSVVNFMELCENTCGNPEVSVGYRFRYFSTLFFLDRCCLKKSSKDMPVSVSPVLVSQTCIPIPSMGVEDLNSGSISC